MNEVGLEDGGEWIDEVAEFDRACDGRPELDGVLGWRTTRVCVVEDDPDPPRRWYLDCIGEVAR